MNQITWEQRKVVYERAIEKFGKASQMNKFFEEIAELQEAVFKREQNRDTIEHIAEEIADVTIVTEQLRLIYGVNDEVCRIMDEKVQRLRDRIAEIDTQVNKATEYRAKTLGGQWVYSDSIWKTLDAKIVLLANRGASIDLVIGGNEEEYTQLRSHSDVPAFVRVDGDTLCRNTWLADSNGAHIYERDVVKKIGDAAYGIVTFSRGRFLLNTFTDAGMFIGENDVWARYSTDMTVIGNTIDNMEYAR